MCEKENMICGVTDKSSKFFLSTESKYKNEAFKHMEGDKEIDYGEVKEIEEQLNSEVKQWKKMFSMGYKWKSQKKRMDSALKTTDSRPPPLTLMLKDHKSSRTDGSKPARPPCLARESPNGVMSDILSEITDRISDNLGLDTECLNTEEMCHHINEVNKLLEKHKAHVLGLSEL